MNCLYNRMYRNLVGCLKSNRIDGKGFRIYTSSRAQNEDNRRLIELLVQAFGSSIIPIAGAFYIHTTTKVETKARVQTIDDLIKANKESSEKRIQATNDLIKANKESSEKRIQAIKETTEKEIQAANDLIKANKETIEKGIQVTNDLIKEFKELSIEMIKAYEANIQNLILKNGSATSK